MKEEAKEPIKLYLDDQVEPFKTDHPPLRFALTTLMLADGPHVLRVEASNGLAPPTIKEIPFRVRNGVAVTVSGLEPNQTIGGQVELIVNAYAGNTEVDFEPRRAETPQPIPTWAWVLSLGVLAWTLFYVFNPTRPPRDASATTFDVGRVRGEQLYMDTCGRCHGEDGRGRRSEVHPDNFLVKRLRDTPKLALEETPYKLLFKVVTGTRATGSVQMPPWGPRMTNEEIVSVVNFVRTSWGHDASQIDPRYRRPPPGVETLEQEILDAMTKKDVEAMSFCCWPDRVRPQLFRIDGPRWATGRDDVVAEWASYFEALGKGEVLDFQLTDVRYDYEPEAVNEPGAYVFAMGRIFLNTRSAEGNDESDTGRFIRVYRRVLNGKTKQDGTPDTQWALLFDFASIRMRVGCAVEDDPVNCPPGTQPGTGPGTTPGTGPGTTPTEGGLGYADIQAIFKGLGKDPGDAPHAAFWNEPYEAFITMKFPFNWEDPDREVKLLEVGNSAESNLIRALRGENLSVSSPDGTFKMEKVARMPKGAAAMPEAMIAKIAAWIDAGCPEKAGGRGAEKGPAKDETSAKDADPSKGGGMGGTSKKAPGPGKDAEAKGAAPKGADAGGSASRVGFQDIVAIFQALGKDVGDAPHEKFWELSYKEFVEFKFPISWDDVDTTIKLVQPWDSDGSNLIKALVDGRGLTASSGGKTKRENIKRMPKGAAPMSEADLERIREWIDGGCPEVAFGKPFMPRPGGGAAAAPKDVPKDAPQDGAKDAPKDGSPKPKTNDLGFEEVIKIFKGLRQKAPNAPHSNFWKDLDYGEFLAFEFPLKYGTPGSIRMLVPWDSAKSNMIKAMRDGKGLIVDLPDGTQKTVDIEPMPKDGDPMDPALLLKLADWIDAGCPEFAGQPSTVPRDGGAAKKPAPAAKDPKAAPSAGGGEGFPAPEGGGK